MDFEIRSYAGSKSVRAVLYGKSSYERRLSVKTGGNSENICGMDVKDTYGSRSWISDYTAFDPSGCRFPENSRAYENSRSGTGDWKCI